MSRIIYYGGLIYKIENYFSYIRQISSLHHDYIGNIQMLISPRDMKALTSNFFDKGKVISLIFVSVCVLVICAEAESRNEIKRVEKKRSLINLDPLCQGFFVCTYEK